MCFIELCVGEIKVKSVLYWSQSTLFSQQCFIAHKKCFNCWIKYTLRNMYFIEQLKHSFQKPTLPTPVKSLWLRVYNKQ